MFSFLLALLFSATPVPASAKPVSAVSHGPVMSEGRLPGQTPHCARRTLPNGSPLREIDSQARRGDVPASAFGVPLPPCQQACSGQRADAPCVLPGRFDGPGHSLRVQFCVWVI